MVYLDDIELMLHEKIMFNQFLEQQFDRILYGHDLRYASARHLVKGVSYGNENLIRAGLRPKDVRAAVAMHIAKRGVNYGQRISKNKL